MKANTNTRQGYNSPSPQYAIELLQYLPARPDYDTWLRAVSAVGNTFDVSTARQILHTRFLDWRPNETVQKLQKRLQNVSFGTLVYIARQHGYNGKTGTYDANYFQNAERYENPKPKIQIDGDAPRFDPVGNRIFRLSVNFEIMNKNLNRDGTPYKDYNTFTNQWDFQHLTADHLTFGIAEGFSFCPAALKSNKKVTSNFDGSEMVWIDIDNSAPDKTQLDGNYLPIEKALSMPITSKAVLLYTTTNHSEDWHKFRIIFALPKRIHDPDIYKQIVKKFANFYNSDQAPTSVTQGFFGNTNAIIFNLINGEKCEYRNTERIS